MKKLSFAMALLVAGCSQRPEFPAETIEAYQTDNSLRAMTLQACSAHATNRTPFATQSDTEECQKATTAQANVNYAAYLEREREANDRLAAQINGLAGGKPAAKR
jgi:non-ribosomal peptide synthetase component F